MMNITLEVSEVCFNLNSYLKRHDISPRTYGISVIDMDAIQKQLSDCIEANLFSIDSLSVNELDLLKVDYFQSSFKEFTEQLYGQTLHADSSVQSIHNYDSIYKKVKNFVYKYQSVLDNWSNTYAPSIERKILSSQIKKIQSPERSKAASHNKI